MNVRALSGLIATALLFYSHGALSGTRSFLDPRSMAMGGAGVASSTKFNASYHNPAMIAFSRGESPDKIYISANLGAREIYDHKLEDTVRAYQANQNEIETNFVDAFEREDTEEDEELSEEIREEQLTAAYALRNRLRDINMDSYRQDETSAFSLLVDTRPVTINFYTRIDRREIMVVRNTDEELIQRGIDLATGVSDTPMPAELAQQLTSSVDYVTFETREFGVSAGSTGVVAYNMPVSWGFTPKLMHMNASHFRTGIREFDPANPSYSRPSEDLLEWNFDIGFAMLLSNEFLTEGLGLDGWWLDGEWVIGIVGINTFPSDFTPFTPTSRDVFKNVITTGNRFQYPANKRGIHPLYRMGIAHYREDFMFTIDMDLVETEVWDFEGLSRFVSIGGEYYLREDLHLRGGTRINVAQTDFGGKDRTIYTAGLMYQPNNFSIEAAMMLNEVEMGGTVGVSVAF